MHNSEIDDADIRKGGPDVLISNSVCPDVGIDHDGSVKWLFRFGLCA
jgi:hypothetical protein